MTDAILNLDMDFFTSPPYFGRFYRDTEATSFSSFYTTSKIWLSVQDFASKLKLTNRIRGTTMRDDSQSYLSIQNLIEKKIIEPKKFTIVNFDAHHDAYVHWDEHWFRSIDGCSNNYDNMIMPFIREWVDEIVWVVPDYMSDEDIKLQFKNMKVEFSSGQVIVFLSPQFQICIKMIKFSNFDPTVYNWKYFCLIQNPEMSRATPDMITDLSKYISRW